nr:DUF3459 domain-containing protein [Actinomycetota bacterium]
FAGFSTTEPWLPLGTDYQRVNVATQQSDPASMLALYRRLIAHRRDSPALREGTWQPIATPPQVIGYERRHHEHVVVVLLNGADSPVQVTLAEPARIVLSTTNRQLAHGAAHTIQLPPRHGLILEPDHTRTQASPTPAAS